jgi:hypothetical protein
MNMGFRITRHDGQFEHGPANLRRWVFGVIGADLLDPELSRL